MELQPIHRPAGVIRPPHTANIYGDYGPRCPHCSGLGHVLTLGGNGGVTRSTSGCRCKGTGVDLELVQQREVQSLIARVAELESKYGTLLSSISTRDQGKMSRQYWSECIAWATSSGAAVGGTAAETVIFPDVPIPANYMADGRALRLYLKGQHSTKSSGTVTVQFSVRWGGVAGTLLCKTGAITQLVSLTAALWEIECEIQTQVNGGSGVGKLMANGTARVYGATAPTIGSATGAPAVAPMTNGGQITPAAPFCNLTLDNNLSVTIIHGASDASNTATGLQYTLESLN